MTDTAKLPKQKRKRRGRPLGSKNHAQPTVPKPTARCPKCRSTHHEVRTVIGRQSNSGTTPDGQPYTSITRRRVRCRSCGQHFITIEHAYEPS